MSEDRELTDQEKADQDQSVCEDCGTPLKWDGAGLGVICPQCDGE
jgi:hypothetical protein